MANPDAEVLETGYKGAGAPAFGQGGRSIRVQVKQCRLGVVDLKSRQAEQLLHERHGAGEERVVWRHESCVVGEEVKEEMGGEPNELSDYRV